MQIQQLIREWPPGFGGVERVAHELASVWGGEVFSFDVQNKAGFSDDPMLVSYRRIKLPCFHLFLASICHFHQKLYGSY